MTKKEQILALSMLSRKHAESKKKGGKCHGRIFDCKENSSDVAKVTEQQTITKDESTNQVAAQLDLNKIAQFKELLDTEEKRFVQSYEQMIKFLISKNDVRFNELINLIWEMIKGTMTKPKDKIENIIDKIFELYDSLLLAYGDIIEDICDVDY
jgi:hypothetical protein